MTYYNRYRSRYGDLTASGGAISRGPPLGDIPPENYFRTMQEMYDVVGSPGTENDMETFIRSNTVGYFSGWGSFYYESHHWPVSDNWYSWDISWGDLIHPTTNNAALAVLAGTNPSRPIVDVPVFAAELKDLPGMLKSAGNRIKRATSFAKRKKSGFPEYSTIDAANDSLALQFGWAPFLADLLKMLGFVKATENRINELDRLYGNSGLKRNYGVTTLNQSKGKRSHYCGPLYSAYASCTVSYEQFYKSWGSVKWRPTSKPEYSDHESQLHLAQQLVAGVKDVGAAQLWELLPWSWLADWFGATGNFLQAHRNTVPADPGPVCIMENFGIRAVSSVLDGDYDGASFSLESDPMIEYKVRHPVFGIPNPDVHLPFLTSKQLSILTPLAVRSLERGLRRR